MDAVTIFNRAHASAPQLPSEDVLQTLAYCEGRTPTNVLYDLHATIREAVTLLFYSQVQHNDRAFVRYLLEQEILAHFHEQEGMMPNLKRCAYMLYRLGNVEDSVLIWQAKDTHFDTLIGIDVQLLIGAGLEQTLAYIRTQPETTDMIEYIEACRETGDFSDMDAFHRDIEQYFDQMEDL